MIEKHGTFIKEACEEHGIDRKTASANEIFEAVCHYDGLLGGYPQRILGWIESIYGIRLDNAKCARNALNIAKYVHAGLDISREDKLQLAAILDNLEYLLGIQ